MPKAHVYLQHVVADKFTMKGTKMINGNPFNKSSRDDSQVLTEVGRAEVALLQSGGVARKISFDAAPATAPSFENR